jgi:hypothetical protein
MAVHDLIFLRIELALDDTHIALKLLMEPGKPRLLQLDKVVDVDQVVAQRHLVLLLSLIQIAIEHLKDRILSVNLTIVVLLENLNFLL